MCVSQVLLVFNAIITLVHYSAASAGRQDLERFEELDHDVLLHRRQGLKCQARSRGFPVVTEVDASRIVVNLPASPNGPWL
jgi:hypothetical protein